MGFLDGIADIAIRGVVGYASSISEAKEAAETLAIAESQDGWISAEAFLAAYDVRIYDLQNDQYDIKIMKDRDFAGGYVLWNKARDCYHTGIGSDVYKKVERHFKGYGNESVFADSESGDEFVVSLFRLENTEYDDLQELGNALRKEFGQYPTCAVCEEGESSDTPTQPGILGLLRRLFG